MVHFTPAERLQMVRSDIAMGLEAADRAMEAPTRELFHRRLHLCWSAHASASRYAAGLTLPPDEAFEIEVGLTLLQAAFELSIEADREGDDAVWPG